jgi:hypothetical protein
VKLWRTAGSSASFRALLDRLLMKEAVGEPFMLQNLIVPVALVDPPTLTATISTIVLGTPATIGETTAPVANTRLADTGQLAAGNWQVLFAFGGEDANGFRIRRRNALDAADVWSFRYSLIGATVNMTPIFLGPYLITLLGNERLAIENINAGSGGRVYQASIWTQGPF